MSTLEPKKRAKNRILNLAYCYLSQIKKMRVVLYEITIFH